MIGSRRSKLIAGACAMVVVGLLGATPASAHPLGNFSINHLDALRFASTSIIDDAIVDTAEIPTAQAKETIDADGDGTASPAELQHYGAAQCDAYRATLTLTVDGGPVTFATTSSTFEYRPGAAGLQTTRLECVLTAPADLSARSSVSFTNGFAPNRVGWHEINATGDGRRLVDSPVPTSSVTKGLTMYPLDLLSSPLDVRTASFDVAPGAGPSTVAPNSAKPSVSSFSKAFGPISNLVERINRVFNDLVGRRQLTLGVGLLAIGLALVLGASHAVLPGHGKTVMAAYIAGRQGSVKDAVIVGATVTATHTGGVLILGMALTISSSLAGESVLGWLGIVSGLMIAALGASLLISARRHRNDTERVHSHGFGKHTHSHGPVLAHHDHDHDHDHDHGGGGGGHVHARRPELALAGHVGFSGHRQSLAMHDLLVEEAVVDDRRTHDERHSAGGFASHVSRRGLIGMGIAGGLVPSPSALVVLLSAIALGRTIFGVILVIGYGLGMAGTLTLAGVLLVRLRDRYQDRADATPGRIRRFAARWGRVAPYLTAALVFVVGLGLALRSVGQV